MIKEISSYLQKKFLKRNNAKLPDLKKGLKRCPRIIQILVLVLHIIVLCIFMWSYSVSFSNFNPNAETLPEDSNPEDSSKKFDLFCYPDIKSLEWGWAVFIGVLLFAAIDILSSISYLLRVLSSWFKWTRLDCYCCSHFSPFYSLIIALESVWLEQISLSCVDPTSGGIIINWSSFMRGTQSVIIILSVSSSVWLKIVETGLCCCFGPSSNQDLKNFLKGFSAFIQSLDVIILIIIWIIKVFDSELDLGIKIVALVFIPIWWLIRVFEYDFNVLIYQQEEEEDDSKKTPLTGQWLEMTQNNLKKPKHNHNETRGNY